VEPIHERLISAYDSIIEAAESGEPGKLSSAVRNSLPHVERFNVEVSSIVQDIDQAVRTQRERAERSRGQ
jgi:hypothetical protein